MKLERIHLRNYRCFEDFTLEVSGESLLVIGPNAGGKTSLMTAIRSALNGGTIDVRDLRDRGTPAELIATVSGLPAVAQADFADAVDLTTRPPTVRLGLRASWDAEEEQLEVVHGFPDAGWRACAAQPASTCR
jgi:predicted ATPase